MAQNGPNDHFGQNDRIIFFSRPKWTTMVHFGPFWPQDVHFGPLKSANRTLAIPEFKGSTESRFPSRFFFFFSKIALLFLNKARVAGQTGMNGDTFSTKAPKDCSKKFAATLRGNLHTRGNVLRIFLFFLEAF